MATGLGDEQLWLCPTLDNATPFNDLSSQGNNGTAVGGLATVADTGSGGAYAYDFDGNVKYMSVGVASAFTAGGSYSISFWAYDAVGLPYWNAYPSVSGATRDQFVYIQNTNARLLAGQVNQSSSYQIANNFHTANQWTHVTVTHDSTSGMLTTYKNGVAFLSTAQAISSNSPTLAEIGRVDWWNGGSVEYSQSLVDDIRAYNRVLTQSEITHLATARGIEGRPFDGLGDEQLWLCPSLENSPNDLSGNNNNGVYQGTMGTVTDTAEGGSLAYDFDGVDDKISVANSASIQDLPAGDYSGSIWIKPDTSGGSGLGEFFNKGYETGVGWELMIRDVSGSTNAIQFSERFSSAVNYGWTTNGAITLSVWQHVAYTFENSTKTSKVYVNGVEIANGTDVNGSGTYATDSANTLYVGARADNARNFDGLIDDARIYNRLLTQSEISWLATERGVLGTPPEGLGDEQLWLCPSIQDGANDLSGNGNDGVIGSSITTVADTSNGGTLAYNFPDTAGTNTITINDFDLGGLSQLTWSAWIYDESDNAASTHSSFFSWRKGGSGNDDILFFNYERSWLGFQVNNGADGQAAYTPVYYQNWKHYCVVFDGTNPTATDRLNLYVNGVLQTPGTTFSYPATTSNQTGTPYAEIGDYVGNGNHGLFNFKGKQDDIRIYDRAITPAEITHLASQRGVLGAPALPTGLGGEQLWLCPSIQDSANDLSGNGNDGTYNGGMGTVADTAEGGSLAYDFDGIDDRIDFGDILDTEVWTSGRWTISQWIYPQDSQINSFLGKYLSGSQQEFITNARDEGNGLRAGAVIYGSLSSAVWRGFEGSTTLNVNQWYHLVIEYDSSQAADDQVRIWLDGTEETINIWASSGTVSNIQDGTQSLRLNGWIDGNSLFYTTTKQDDIRVYDRAITQAEISWLATERGVLGAAPEGLGGETCWICPTLTQNSTTDITNSGLTITTTGNVTVTADTGAGGTHANFCQGNGTNATGHEVIIDNFGNTYAEATSVSWWSRRTAGSIVIEFGGGANLWPGVIDFRFFYQSWSNSHDRAYMYNTSGGTNGWINETLSNATWKHHVMVREGVGGKNRLYINGVLDTEEYDDGGAEFTGKDMYLGVGGGSSSDSELYMDDMRTYGRVLTQAEITHLATSRGVLGSPSTTTQYNAFVTHAFRQLFQTRLR